MLALKHGMSHAEEYDMKCVLVGMSSSMVPSTARLERYCNFRGPRYMFVQARYLSIQIDEQYLMP